MLRDSSGFKSRRMVQASLLYSVMAIHTTLTEHLVPELPVKDKVVDLTKPSEVIPKPMKKFSKPWQAAGKAWPPAG